jgi:RNA polymerase sigma-70 factor (ECF subfamily)
MNPSRCSIKTETQRLEIFESLYQEHRSAVFAYSMYLARNREEAEDLFQTAWVRIAKSLPEIIDFQSIKSWIFTIVINLHRDGLRKKRVRQLFIFEALSHDKQDESKFSDLNRDLNKAIAKLPEKQRRIFVLKEVAGFQQSEISGMLGIPVGTIKSLMHRAVKRLQRELSAYQPKSLPRSGSYAL